MSDFYIILSVKNHEHIVNAETDLYTCSRFIG